VSATVAAIQVPPSLFWNGMSLAFMPKKPVTNVGGSKQAVRMESVNSRRLVMAGWRGGVPDDLVIGD